MNDNEKTPLNNLSAEAQEYYKQIRELAPETMTNLEVVAALGNVLTSYARGPHHASEIIDHLHISTLAYYSQHSDLPCDCPNCTDRRQKAAH
jgi:hypothetical protein